MDIWTPSNEFWEHYGDKRFSLSDLKPEVPKLSIDQLVFAMFTFIADKLKNGQVLNEPSTVYYISHQILRYYLGNEWVEANVFDESPGKAKWHEQGRAFLKSDSKDEADNFRHQHRLIELAEGLYNLQHIPGIDHRIALLQKENLLSVFGELQCARMMATPSSQLQFIVPENEHRPYPDAALISTSGRTLYCEIKSKDETTPLDEKSVMVTIENARQQLPSDAPGIVWLSIPEAWSKQAGAKAIVDNAIKKKLKRSGRLVAVLVAFEIWEPQESGWLMQARFTAALNTKGRHYQKDVESTLEELGSYKNDSWHTLQDIVSVFYQRQVDFVRQKLTSEG